MLKWFSIVVFGDLLEAEGDHLSVDDLLSFDQLDGWLSIINDLKGEEYIGSIVWDQYLVSNLEHIWVVVFAVWSWLLVNEPFVRSSGAVLSEIFNLIPECASQGHIVKVAWLSITILKGAYWHVHWDWFIFQELLLVHVRERWLRSFFLGLHVASLRGYLTIKEVVLCLYLSLLRLLSN